MLLNTQNKLSYLHEIIFYLSSGDQNSHSLRMFHLHECKRLRWRQPNTWPVLRLSYRNNMPSACAYYHINRTYSQWMGIVNPNWQMEKWLNHGISRESNFICVWGSGNIFVILYTVLFESSVVLSGDLALMLNFQFSHPCSNLAAAVTFFFLLLVLKSTPCAVLI